MSKTDNGKHLEENNTLMANGRTKPEKTTISQFIYNKRDGTFLGRTGKSWGQIIGFYIVFYIFLAAFWIACLAIFLSTIDKEVPRYYGKDTIIGANPGVGYQPWLKEDPESTLIKFNPKDPNSYKQYTGTIDAFLEKYNNTNHTRLCPGADSNSDFVSDGKATRPDIEACRFELAAFEKDCGKDKDYGFREGKPCVILSLNRLIGWKPESYEGDAVPVEVRSRYKPGSIAFNCKGISDPDKELVGHIRYIPPEGINGRYYPYAVMSNYHQPFAVVKFSNLPKNRVVMVECGAYARNIEQDEDSRAGMVTFELLKQEVEAKKA